MRTLRIVVVSLVIVGLNASAFAGDLRSSAAKAGEQQTPSAGRSIPKGYLWTGGALFVGGMAVGIYGFLNNRNGRYPEFGEAQATNKHLGTAGLALAFAGGTILFLGERRAHSSALTVGPGRVTLSKRLSW